MEEELKEEVEKGRGITKGDYFAKYFTEMPWREYKKLKLLRIPKTLMLDILLGKCCIAVKGVGKAGMVGEGNPVLVDIWDDISHFIFVMHDYWFDYVPEGEVIPEIEWTVRNKL